jgi:hypothetical protein
MTQSLVWRPPPTKSPPSRAERSPSTSSTPSRADRSPPRRSTSSSVRSLSADEHAALPRGSSSDAEVEPLSRARPLPKEFVGESPNPSINRAGRNGERGDRERQRRSGASCTAAICTSRAARHLSAGQVENCRDGLHTLHDLTRSDRIGRSQNGCSVCPMASKRFLAFGKNKSTRIGLPAVGASHRFAGPVGLEACGLRRPEPPPST